MWANIAAARRAARATPVARTDRVDRVDPIEKVDTPVVPLHRRDRTIWRWSAALAAGLVLGIAVDRALVGRDASDTRVVAQATDAPASAPGSSSLPAQVGIGAPPNSPSITPSTSTPSSPSSPASSSTKSTSPAAPRLATIDPRPTTEPNTNADTRVERTMPDPRDLYHAAALQTLVQAEALLTAYRSTDGAVRDPQAIQQAARWARDVLSSTRLLMDSPAARDPRMRVLFSDLELVLAQIVQLSGAPLEASERDLIERALRDRDLLPRLRSAVPAGLATS
jgi:hypothetical protein